MTTSTALTEHIDRPGGPPLSRYSVLQATDIDATREWMEKFGDRPIRIAQLDRSATEILQNAAGMRNVGFAFESYGAGTSFEVERTAADPYLVFFPTAGRILSRLGNQELLARPDLAAVFSPAGPLALRYRAGTQGFQVRIDREILETRLRQMLGGNAPRTFAFEMAMDLDTPAARTWRQLVDVAIADLDGGGGIVSSPLAAASLENAIIDALLVAQPHNFSEKLEHSGPTARPRTIQRAVNLIHDHCHEPLSTGDIAEAVGLSARSLQEGFQTHVGTTPMAYLRRTRLQQIRDELRASDPATTNVTRVALDWGMTHLGRFAQAYRVEFGEAPSETLRLGT
jgi:AraC-like DNA-binding protein